MYFMICHTANLAGYGEFIEVVAGLHKGILEKNPDFFESVNSFRN